MRTFLLLGVLLPFFTFSQNCNCDITLSGLSATSLNLIWASQVSYSPGDVICIPGGTYGGIRFYDFEGTASAPLTIKNCNGQVEIDESGYSGIEFRNSKYIHLTGTGDANHTYGFKVLGTSSWAMGLSLGNLSTDFEIDHIEIDSAGFAGIMAKTDPVCDKPETWRVNGFIMENLDIHDNYIKNTGGEGIYIGFTLGYKLDVGRTCSGTPIYGHWLENVEVHNNILENIGWDGIQLNLVRLNGSIHDNYIYNYGTEDRYAQDFAMSFGGGIYDVYNNMVINGPAELGQGFQMINGQSGSKIFNNVIVRPKLHGIFSHARHEFEDPNEGYYIANNTIIEPERAGVHYNTTLLHPVDPANLHKAQDGVPSYFVNNLVVDPGYDFANGNTWKQDQESYFDFNEKSTRDSLLTNIYDNFMTRQMDTLGLTDILNDDYSISSASSPLIDIGSDLTAWSITFDIENVGRPSGSSFDVGAYEFIQSAPLKLAIDEEPELWDIQSVEESFSFFPNPTTSKVYLDSDLIEMIEIYNFAGQLLKETRGNVSEIDFESYPSGIYFIKIFSPSNENTLKVVKN